MVIFLLTCFNLSFPFFSVEETIISSLERKKEKERKRGKEKKRKREREKERKREREKERKREREKRKGMLRKGKEGQGGLIERYFYLGVWMKK